jgi:membrane-bound acyltransferase YfiQ involved in biofilm formation
MLPLTLILSFFNWFEKALSQVISLAELNCFCTGNGMFIMGTVFLGNVFVGNIFAGNGFNSLSNICTTLSLISVSTTLASFALYCAFTELSSPTFAVSVTCVRYCISVSTILITFLFTTSICWVMSTSVTLGTAFASAVAYALIVYSALSKCVTNNFWISSRALVMC